MGAPRFGVVMGKTDDGGQTTALRQAQGKQAAGR